LQTPARQKQTGHLRWQASQELWRYVDGFLNQSHDKLEVRLFSGASMSLLHRSCWVLQTPNAVGCGSSYQGGNQGQPINTLQTKLIT
jgi:hypothetical protein